MKDPSFILAHASSARELVVEFGREVLLLKEYDASGWRFLAG